MTKNTQVRVTHPETSEITVEGCMAQARAIAPQAPTLTLIEWKVALEQNHAHLLALETVDHCSRTVQQVKQIRTCLIRAIAQLLQG